MVQSISESFFPTALNDTSLLTRMPLEFYKLDQSLVDIFSNLMGFFYICLSQLFVHSYYLVLLSAFNLDDERCTTI